MARLSHVPDRSPTVSSVTIAEIALGAFIMLVIVLWIAAAISESDAPRNPHGWD